MDKRIGYFPNIILDITLTIGFISMLLCAIMQVIFRYVIRISVPWTEEAARYLLILVTFWGGALALREKEHITIPVLFDRLPKITRGVIQMVFIIAITVFLVFVFQGSLVMIKLTWNTPVGAISWLTMGRVYLILPTGVFLMIVYLGVWAFETIKELILSLKKE